MSMIPILNLETNSFPDVTEAILKRDGLVAIGGDLSIARLLCAYKQGIFPWFSANEPICWWALSPRMVLFPVKIHIGRSLQKNIRHQQYCVTVNHDFVQVMENCAVVKRPQQHDTWITASMRQAYADLHQAGFAHSFEYWIKENGQMKLMGGLYGVQIGQVFFGESMFALSANASKIAFVLAVEYLQRLGVELIDCQMHTEHLVRFGAEEQDFSQFQQLLQSLCVANLTEAVGRRILKNNL